MYTRRRRNPMAKKLKLVCSFNGGFCPRPQSGKIRYVGGETRIISVDRNIGFLKLRSKISELCPKSHSFSLKYNLHVSCSLMTRGVHDDDVNPPLILISSDDDVRCMVEEYEKLELYGKSSRLWVYVCSGNGSNGSGSLRNVVLKQNLLDKKSDDRVLGDVECTFSVVEKNGDNPIANSTSGLKVSLKHEIVNRSGFRAQNYGIGRAHMQPLSPRNENSCAETRANPLPCLSRQCGSKKLCDSGANLMLNGCDTKQGLRNREFELMSNLNRENIGPWNGEYKSVKAGLVPLSCGNQLMGSADQSKASCGEDRVWGSSHGGIKNHRFGVSETKNQRQRACPYHARNYRSNFHEMGSHRNGRLDGRHSVGRYHLSLRANSSISKQGQAVRLYCPNYWKAWFGHTLDRTVRMVDSTPSNNKSSLVLQSSKESRGEEQIGREVSLHGKPKTEEQAYPGAYDGVGGHSFLPCDVIEKPSMPGRAMDTQEDLLIGPNSGKTEVPYEDLNRSDYRTSADIKSAFCDEKKEAFPMDMLQFVNILDVPNTPGCSNEAKLECCKQFPDVAAKSSSNDHDGTVKGGIATSLELSLHTLSLSSSKVESQPCSSITGTDVSEALPKPHSKPVDLINEGEMSTGAPVEFSNRFASNANPWSAAKLEKDNMRGEEIQIDPSSKLSIDEKSIIQESLKCSLKIGGGNSSDIAAFYAHLATQGLQTIESSDIECIKELGSGTYGTVFYGKWRGSDVAIKMIKPSCITDGAAVEDRLVADFWKEAHMLGQLHHPNIVALYGVVKDGPITNLATVTEYMVNGSLKQVLRRKDRTIDRRKRHIIAMDAAFGMEYLHEKNIVHFDLKSHNFLVNMRDPHRPVCKIGDLGLSKIKQRTLVSGGLRGTIPWMAPELLNSQNGLVTEKIDVYSFGIVMWELLTGEEPYGNLRSEEIIARIIKGDLRPEIPSWCDPAWRSLMERCWSSDPNSRPSFSEIAKELRAMSVAMNIK